MKPVALTDLRHVIIDMDGVLYRGTEAIPGAREFLLFTRRIGVPFLLLTNNSSMTAAQYKVKLAGMDMVVSEDEILPSAAATAMYLARLAGPGTPVYMIGEEGLRMELEQAGFKLREDTAVKYVVVGWDRKLTWEKLKVATQAILAGAKFIGTNPDRTYPSESGIVPGAGAIQAALEACTGVQPEIVGKPQTAIFQLGLERLGAQAATTASIGDRLETDIVGGQRAGLPTILMLSGVTSKELLATSPIVPDLVYQDLADLQQAWEKALRRSL
jgi:4-nitrophenyl phosphatase